MSKHKLSVVIPVYYNAESLPELHERLSGLADTHPSFELEIIFVDDYSGDDSYEVIRGIAAQDERVIALKLSRNFGSFNACLAGLTRATGDCAAIISADLQDPPELIGEMYERWVAGAKVVMAVRARRQETFFRVLLSKIYYVVFRALVDNAMPRGGFDFVLIDRKVVDSVCAMQEKNTTLMGLILWTGFRRQEIPYTRVARKYGKSRWSWSKKVNYFVDSLLAFTNLPIRLVTFLGIFACLLSFLGVIYIFVAVALGWMDDVVGWPSLMTVILFIFSSMMISIGILGEYVWRSLEESRKRPSFIVESEYRRDGSAAPDG